MKVSLNNIVLSCEHGGHRIPAAYRHLYSRNDVLAGHRGWDAGALECARRMSNTMKMPLISSTTSRLLIDLNRSLHHRQLFSEFSRQLPEVVRQSIINDYYLPYREQLHKTIADLIARYGFALHLSIHSFTQVMNNTRRNADIGILYDPGRRHETELACSLQESLQAQDRGLIVRRNYPYLGTADGATSYYRNQFAAGSYAGLEIEINQKYPLGRNNNPWRRLQKTIIQALIAVIPARLS